VDTCHCPPVRPPVAPSTAAGQAEAQEFLNAERHTGRHLRPVRLALQHRAKNFRHVVSLERRTPGQHLVEHTAEREDVRAPINRSALRLFRRHVSRRAEDDALLRRGQAQRRRVREIRIYCLRLERLRQPEVQHLHRAIASHLDVGGLQVAMNDAVLVRRFQRVHDLLGNRQDFLNR